MGGTKKPTKKEQAWLDVLLDAGCMACHLNPQLGLRVTTSHLERHHLKNESGQRRGHLFTICLCYWHHQSEPPIGMSKTEATTIYGPGLKCGTKPFKAVYGTDDSLLELQRQLLARLAMKVDWSKDLIQKSETFSCE